MVCDDGRRRGYVITILANFDVFCQKSYRFREGARVRHPYSMGRWAPTLSGGGQKKKCTFAIDKEKEKLIKAIQQKGLSNSLISLYYNIGKALPFRAQSKQTSLEFARDIVRVYGRYWIKTTKT